MSKIFRRVDRNIPVTLRSQEFSNLDAVEGDVLMVETSLGKLASHATIRTVNGSLRVRFNVYQTVFPHRGNDSLNAQYTLNTASGTEYKLGEADTADYIVEADTSVDFFNRFPIRDIELVTVSGTFTVQVS
jgi:hypothetical protein